MIWATVSSRSCFCWLCRASPSLTAKNIINLISVLTIWWCPCVKFSLVLLEEGVCYDQCVLLAELYQPLSCFIRRSQRQPTPVLLPGKSCGRRSLVGCSPWGRAKSRTRLSDFTFAFHFHALEKEICTQSSVLTWRIPGTAEPGGLPCMGSHRVGHDWSDLAAAAAASFRTPRPNLPVIPGVSWLPTFVFQSPIMKRTSAFFGC